MQILWLFLFLRFTGFTGRLPDDWLLASVTPIFEKGGKFSSRNYRPVSLVSVVFKICERIINARILDFVYVNKLLPESQHGFSPGESVITNSLHGLNDLTSSYERNFPVDLAYIDFSKAFDRVPDRRFLIKHGHKRRSAVLDRSLSIGSFLL